MSRGLVRYELSRSGRARNPEIGNVHSSTSHREVVQTL